MRVQLTSRALLLLLLALLASLAAAGGGCGKKPEPPAAAPAPPAEVPAAPDVGPATVDVGLSPEEAAAAAAAEAERKFWLEPPSELSPPADAETLPSGLATKVLRPGTGTVHPRAEDAVLAHYSVWTEQGDRIDASWRRGEPRLFQVGRQIAGWEEGIKLMVVGERRRLWIPAKMAFHGRMDKPQGMLVWDAELVELRRAPDAPPDVARPPRDANRTASGLYWMELAPGAGDGRRPGARSMVRVNYTGWTTDGKVFDSTVLAGKPASFAVDTVIQGWTEGLQLMTVGQKMRFWIPKKLAYKGERGKPKGMLVFDIELLELGG